MTQELDLCRKKLESVGEVFFFHASVRAARLECTVEVTGGDGGEGEGPWWVYGRGWGTRRGTPLEHLTSQKAGKCGRWGFSMFRLHI